MRFDLLQNSAGLYLVDCEVEPHQLSCGWVYAEPGLPEICSLFNRSREIVRIRIPEVVQQASGPMTLYFKNDVVKFITVTS